MTTMAFMIFICGGTFACEPFPANTKMYTSAEQCKAAIEADQLVPALRQTYTFKCMGKPVSLWQPVE